MVILGSCGIWVQGTRAGGVVCTGRLCLLPPRGSAAQPGTHSELPSDWNSFVLLWKSEVPNRGGGDTLWVIWPPHFSGRRKPRMWASGRASVSPSRQPQLSPGVRFVSFPHPVVRKLGQVLPCKQEGPRDLAAWHQ